VTAAVCMRDTLVVVVWSDRSPSGSYQNMISCRRRLFQTPPFRRGPPPTRHLLCTGEYQFCRVYQWRCRGIMYCPPCYGSFCAQWKCTPWSQPTSPATDARSRSAGSAGSRVMHPQRCCCRSSPLVLFLIILRRLPTPPLMPRRSQPSN
jgi:hypothetical protein